MRRNIAEPGAGPCLNWQQRRLSVAPARLRQFSRSDPCPASRRLTLLAAAAPGGVRVAGRDAAEGPDGN
ncbi:MAG: hypothetical protein WAO08_03580, partial [Hyphomicrobiaceae bacterium]